MEGMRHAAINYATGVENLPRNTSFTTLYCSWASGGVLLISFPNLPIMALRMWTRSDSFVAFASYTVMDTALVMSSNGKDNSRAIIEGM